MKKVLIMIPTYNEAASITSLLKRLDDVIKTLSAIFEIDLLIIDDTSPDATSQIALSTGLQNLQVITQSKKNGIGPAYKRGFEVGLKRDYSLFVQMDADLSHQPEQLPKLLAASNSKNLVIGSRWIAGGEVVNWPKSRRLISKFGTTYASMSLRLKNKDLTSGYRVLPRELVEQIDFTKIQSIGYGFQIEMALIAATKGFEILEVPITFIERQNGKSKMSIGIVFEAWKVVTYEGVRRVFHRR